jgi:hypothetical protein
VKDGERRITTHYPAFLHPSLAEGRLDSAILSPDPRA